ncbi:MAG: DUF455 domain-containing protein [Deltaproteobacteria bacterium]|nr:MAG: DUF455 domain-containing protein [Deltaproteobacteria bacterium]
MRTRPSKVSLPSNSVPRPRSAWISPKPVRSFACIVPREIENAGVGDKQKRPPDGTLDAWAYDYVLGSTLLGKLEPPAPPEDRALAPASRPLRLEAPGRPPELEVRSVGVRARRGGLRGEKARARLVHAFHHHELQAAELMCWALLAFPEAPAAFREGLVRIALDEVRHMGFYREHLTALGYSVGDFPVRDWFWERVPRVTSPAAFVAVMGMGFEGGNLDHAARFTERFRDVGDDLGARVQEQVGREEIAHVRFAVRWFEEFTGKADFETWARHLPAPLSPMVMRGKPVQRELRLRAGMSEDFVEEMVQWQPAPGS